jgi:hypothetical protein
LYYKLNEAKGDKMDYKNYRRNIVYAKKSIQHIKKFIDNGDTGAVWNCLTDLELSSKWLWQQYNTDMGYPNENE